MGTATEALKSAQEAINDALPFCMQPAVDALKPALRQIEEALSTTRSDREDAERVPPLQVRSYKVDREINIERCGQIEGPDKWAVRKPGACLNKRGEWEWEPLPSSRDDEFLERCRFATAVEAYAAIDTARNNPGEAG